MTVFTAVGVRGGRLAEVAGAFPLAAEHVLAAAGKKRRINAEQSVSGLYALLLLMRHIGADTRTLSVVRDEGGKPRFAPCGPHFSIAHSANVAVCALSDSPVGADVERLRDKPDAVPLAARFFSEREAECVRLSADAPREFFRLWTRKEARLKQRGEGVDRIISGVDALGGEFTERVLRFGGEEYLACVTGRAEYIPTEDIV